MVKIILSALVTFSTLFLGCTKDTSVSVSENGLPRITSQPSPQTIRIGQNVTFTVVATGDSVLAYQWRKDGSNISGATSSSYNISNVSFSHAGYYSVNISNSCGYVTSISVTLNVEPCGMKYVTGSTFLMGDSLYATPIHTVTVSSFWMDSTEVTQADYYALTGLNPSTFKNNMLQPVEQISWYDAVLYCNARSKRDGCDTVYTFTAISGTAYNGCTGLTDLAINMNKTGYRLPTEAEWEFACRGGTTTTWHWSDTYIQAEADAYSWNGGGFSGTTQIVSSKLSNGYGLYDMAGNVWEWCSDLYGSYSSDAQINPIGAMDGSYRVTRGGSWRSGGYYYLRCGYRHSFSPDNRDYLFGFRCAL
ncbi:MAG: SUMF1/EgtB/PvdO family nonheme iron enzyme [Fibrobacteres bacterium]|nr:SUMF1/EgtB/PvdO family nonheme iron enzyme [Fibrobacterota bacterium]